MCLKDGSEFLIGTLENNGNINTNSNDCFCFTVLNGTVLTQNSSILNQFVAQGGGNCNCAYSTGEAHNATIVELDEVRITPTTILENLAPGEHVIKVDIDGCEVAKEVIISGGLNFEIMGDKTICAGDEILIGGDIEADDATITWDNTESLIDF